MALQRCENFNVVEASSTANAFGKLPVVKTTMSSGAKAIEYHMKECESSLSIGYTKSMNGVQVSSTFLCVGVVGRAK